MEPLDYLKIIRRRWVVIVAAVVLSAWIGLLVSLLDSHSSKPKTYKATQTLLYSAPGPASGVAVPTLAQTALLATAGDVPKRAAAKLNYTGDPAVLAERVTAEAKVKDGALTISSKGRNGPKVAGLVNAFAGELVAVLDERAAAGYQASTENLRARLDQIKARVNALDAALPSAGAGTVRDTTTAERDALVNQYRLAYDQYQQLAAQGGAPRALVPLQAATPIEAKEGFHPPTSGPARVTLAAVVGLVLGVALVFLLDRLDSRIGTKESASEAFDLPVIAEIPSLPRRWRHRVDLHLLDRPTSPFAEAHRILRTVLLLGGTNLEPNGNEPSSHGFLPEPKTWNQTGAVVLVSSPGPAEGKTTTVANLAVALAEAGRSVLVLDCDFRRPSLHEVFDVPAVPGLTDVLSGTLALPDAVQRSTVRNVWVVPAGRPARKSAASLLSEGAGLLDDARKMADFVLIDTGPLLVANDASELMGLIDGVLVVCRAGVTPYGAAERATELLERVSAPIIGVVLVAAAESPSSGYYHYHYRYAAPDEKPQRRRHRRKRRSPALQSNGSAASSRAATEARMDQER